MLLDPERMAAFNLSAAEIHRAVVAANPPSFRRAQSRYRSVDVETGQFLTDAKDVASLVVGVASGNPVYLSDVAEIVDGPPPPSRYIWLGRTRHAGRGDRPIEFPP